MKKVLLDTNTYSRLIDGNIDILSEISLAHTIFMSPIILGELYVGFKGGSKIHENEDMLRRFLQQETVEICPISSETAEIYAAIQYRLRKSGTPIPTNDVWIASQAIETGSMLVTYDRHFSKIPGLRLWNKFPQK